jgi:hypothetical protein
MTHGFDTIHLLARTKTGNDPMADFTVKKDMQHRQAVKSKDREQLSNKYRQIQTRSKTVTPLLPLLSSLSKSSAPFSVQYWY